MISDIKVSIVCPIYNAEKHLKECILSVLNQTYKNIELLLINDGSTDGSLNICRYYSNLDKRVILINIRNCGASEARNIGIKAASGSYICFIDSDDYFELDLIEKCLKRQATTNADIVRFGYRKINEDGTFLYVKELENKVYKHSNRMQKIDFISETLLKYCVPIQMWSCFLKTEYFKKFDLFLIDRKIVFSEDVCFSICSAMSLNTTACINEPLYNFRRRTGSIMWTNKEGNNYNLNEYNNMSKLIFKKYCFEKNIDFFRIHKSIIDVRLKNIKIKKLKKQVALVDDKNYFFEMNKGYYLYFKNNFFKDNGIYYGSVKKAVTKYLFNNIYVLLLIKMLFIYFFIKPFSFLKMKMLKLKSYLCFKKKTRFILKKFIKYIEPGFYVFSVFQKSSTFRKAKLSDFFKFYKLIHIKGSGKINFFQIKKGTEKVNFICDLFVASEFYVAAPLNDIKRNVLTYLNQLVLPHIDYIEFLNNSNTIITPFVNGESYFDEKHNNILLSKLLDFSLISNVVFVEGFAFYVQHGDAYGGNIIWHNNNFVSIDNEGVNLYPAFYDVFILISFMVETPREFYEKIIQYQEIFIKFCANNSITYNESLIDNYLCLFIYFRLKSYYDNDRKKIHRPFLFLNHEDSMSYFPKASKLLRNLSLVDFDEFNEKVYLKIKDYNK